MSRENRQHLGASAELALNAFLTADLAKLDYQVARLELGAASKPKVLICT